MSYCNFQKFALPAGSVARLYLRGETYTYPHAVLIVPPGLEPSDDLVASPDVSGLLVLGTELALPAALYRTQTEEWLSSGRPVCFVFQTMGDALTAHRDLSGEAPL